MKDLGKAQNILGMQILRNEENDELRIGQKKYLRKVLSRFEMSSAKSVLVPIAQHFRLIGQQSPSIANELAYMNKVSYLNVVGSIMYVIICTS